MMRADENAATIAHILCAAHGVKGSDGNVMGRDAFLMWKEEPELSLEEAMRKWS